MMSVKSVEEITKQHSSKLSFNNKVDNLNTNLTGEVNDNKDSCTSSSNLIDSEEEFHMVIEKQDRKIEMGGHTNKGIYEMNKEEKIEEIDLLAQQSNLLQKET